MKAMGIKSTFISLPKNRLFSSMKKSDNVQQSNWGRTPEGVSLILMKYQEEYEIRSYKQIKIRFIPVVGTRYICPRMTRIYANKKYTEIPGDFPGELEKLGDGHHKRSDQYFGYG
jgi:hypothetical protein